MMIQDPWTSSSKGVRTKDWLQMELEKHSSWICWHENIGTKDLWSAWIEMDIGWHIWFAFILHKKCQICFSLSFFARSARSDSLTFFTRCAWWFSLSSQETPNLYYAFIFMLGSPRTLVQNPLPTDPQGENLFFYVSADCTQEKCSREGERQLQQVSDILRQKMQGETATSSSCLFMLSWVIFAISLDLWFFR